MTTIFDNIKASLGRSNILKRLIIINVVIFLLINLPIAILGLFKANTFFIELIVEKLAVPASLKTLATQPWSLITYEFVHEKVLHILFNMLWLFWMGQIFVEYLGSKKILSVYILGGIAGGILYIIFFNVFPLFEDSVYVSYAIGASASVLAITIAIATLLPDYTIMLLFFGPVKLKYIALFAILLDLISMSGSNAGGHIAHLGGAIFGFTYIKQLRAGNDLGRWFENLVDWIMMLFKPRPKMRVAHRKTSTQKTVNTEPDQEAIDRILDKISKSGYASLSDREKEILFKASKKSPGEK